MVNIAFITDNKELINFIKEKKEIEIFTHYSDFLNNEKEFNIIFYHDIEKNNNFLDVYYEVSNQYEDIIFIVIYEKIDIKKLKKGLKEGIYDFISKADINKKLDLILKDAEGNFKNLIFKEKIYEVTTHKIYIKIKSDVNLVNETVLQIISTAKISGFIKNKKLENDIRLALTEGVANAIVHGNKNDQNKFVEIDAYLNYNMLKISIKDMGSGFEIKKDINPLEQENILKSSGRGIYLMKVLMDEVEYIKEENKLILVKYKKKRE